MNPPDYGRQSEDVLQHQYILHTAESVTLLGEIQHWLVTITHDWLVDIYTRESFSSPKPHTHLPKELFNPPPLKQTMSAPTACKIELQLSFFDS